MKKIKTNIKHSVTNNGQHCIEVQYGLPDGDHLIFVFKDEGVIISEVSDGDIVATMYNTYDEIEVDLGFDDTDLDLEAGYKRCTLCGAIGEWSAGDGGLCHNCIIEEKQDYEEM
jgi:hypothetical protein